ncbi:META domain-containing protein [Dokdonia genika]|uniref:META domain-containing protein n=1 Tax=Dokdonia genika TaxID=308113 RepID=A0ABV9L7X0_9FLAO
MTKHIITLAVIALTMLSCNSTMNTTSEIDKNNMDAMEAMNQSTWQLIRLDGKTIDQSQMDRKIRFQLNPIDKTISGFSGCNTFNGSYTSEEGNRISFTQLASTKMACRDNAVNENNVLKVFNLADNLTIQGDNLMIKKGRRAPLAIFKKVTIENQITEKYWKLKTLEGENVTMADNQEREIYFMLKNDGRVTGFAGCNTINGAYSLQDGNRIRFTNMATTLKACPDVDVNESEFLNVFNTADNYTIVDDVLSLNVGRRAPLAVFEAVYFK